MSECLVDGRLTCEVVGQHVVARVLGGPTTAAALEEGHAELLTLVRSSGHTSVLYDLRELDVQSAQALLQQESSEREASDLRLRRAIVVSNMSVGYLARLAFSADECGVFFRDYDSAVRYLSKGGLPTSAWSLAVSEERRVRERRSQVERQVAGRRARPVPPR
jgi:hypothetical protein